VRDQINELFPGTAPDAPLQPSTGHPRCTVLMLPSTNVEGTLETLVQDATRAADATMGARCDDFLAMCHAENWNSTSRHSMAWLRANLAIRCRNPFVPLGDVFTEPENDGIILLNHGSLNHVAQVLSGFSN
jgi:hypothetical protein